MFIVITIFHDHQHDNVINDYVGLYIVVEEIAKSRMYADTKQASTHTHTQTNTRTYTGCWEDVCTFMFKDLLCHNETLRLADYSPRELR